MDVFGSQNDLSKGYELFSVVNECCRIKGVIRLDETMSSGDV